MPLLPLITGPGFVTSIGHERAADPHRLGERFGGQVSFLRTNDPAPGLFALKAALEAGDSLALKCDRLGFSAKVGPFQFLGVRRHFQAVPTQLEGLIRQHRFLWFNFLPLNAAEPAA